MLYRHCQRPEFSCRFRWEAGAVAFWDNRATLHYAVDDYGDALRIAHRVTLRGDRPYGPACPRVCLARRQGARRRGAGDVRARRPASGPSLGRAGVR